MHTYYLLSTVGLFLYELTSRFHEQGILEFSNALYSTIRVYII